MYPTAALVITGHSLGAGIATHVVVLHLINVKIVILYHYTK
jgi:putative lipase involved disintegration of autophagic bodies